ncbi:hypothetical protein EV126DRAFT_224261 [Verticillium dahliae]|nr:hypothetical protein EV126DRAFT_224261 [Verticillium dahliae]
MSAFCCCRTQQGDDENVANSSPLPNAIPVPVLPLPVKVSDTRLCESWTPDNTARIQPSLQQGTAASLRSLGAASSNSSLMPNHESIEVGQLVVENSNSDVDTADAPTSGKKSNSPLDLVRTKFHRNKSHHSSRTGPRAGLGASEEEMARRAELKRIMHKRIQEELKSEEEQPEPSTGSASAVKYSTTPIDFPGGGPRDHLEFSIANASLADAEARKDAADEQSNAVDEPIKDERDKEYDLSRRRSSCPQSSLFSTPGGLATLVVLRERNSLPELPPSPGMRPVGHLDAQNALSSEPRCLLIHTGRPEQMADVRGSPNCHSSYHVDNSPDGNSALCTWLMTQGLSNHAHITGRAIESPLKLASEIEGTTTKVPQATALRYCSSLETPALTKGQTCQHLQHCQDDDTVNYSLPNKETSIARDVRCTDCTVGANIFDTSCPSKETVRLPTPEIPSTGSESRKATTSLHGLQLSPFRWLGSDGDSFLKGSDNLTLGGNESGFSLIVPTTTGSRRQTADVGSSLAVSETSSYRHQEAELKTIEKRFGDVLSKRGRPPLKHSKFREEFEETGPPVAITRSSFLLQKLHIPVLKRAKSSSKTDVQATPRSEAPAETLVVGLNRGSVRSPNQPLHSHEGTSTRTSTPHMYSTPTLEESTTDLWQRAVQLERESRKGAVRAAAVKKDRKKLASNSSVHLKVGRWRGVQRSKSLESTNASDANVPNPQHSSAGDDPDRQKQPASPSCLGTKLPGRVMHDEQKRYQPHHESEDRGERVLQNPNIGIPPPEAWSRWPSQTRKERTAAAGYSDGMKSRDFAIVASTGDGRIEWITDKDPAALMTDLQLGSRSFSGKFGKAVKTGLEKLLPPKSGPLDEAGRSLSGHVAFAGKRLEYPELEILPTEGGYKELKALEQGIDIVKNRHLELPTRATATDMRKRSMSHTIPILVRAAEQERHDCIQEDDIVSEAILTAADAPQPRETQARPVTPAQLISRPMRESIMIPDDYFTTPLTSRRVTRRTRDSTLTTGTIERYVTPRSHISRTPSLRSPSSMSMMSSSTVVRRCKSAAEPTPSQTNLSAYEGRSIAQPDVLRSTQEFQDELDRRLNMEKGETFTTTRTSIEEGCSEHTLPPLH